MTAPNLVYLKGMLFNFKMDTSKSMDENADEFTRLALLLRSTDQALGDTSEAMILLNSLLDEYDVVKHALRYTRIVPSLDLVISGIKARELELNTTKKSGNNLFVKAKSDKKNYIGNSDQSSETRFKGKKKDKKGKQKQSKWKCYHCGKDGHIKKYCYNFIRKQKQGGNTNINAGSSNCLAEILTVSSLSMENEWVMDSDCSFHMCPNREWFQNFNKKETGTVYMRNNQSCSVQGIGNIPLKLHNNKVRILTDVRYVPDLKRNLISLNTLDELGFLYKAENGFMHILKGDNLIMSGSKKYGLYILNGCYHLCNIPKILETKIIIKISVFEDLR